MSEEKRFTTAEWLEEMRRLDYAVTPVNRVVYRYKGWKELIAYFGTLVFFLLPAVGVAYAIIAYGACSTPGGVQP